jgi:hypothetical protein
MSSYPLPRSPYLSSSPLSLPRTSSPLSQTASASQLRPRSASASIHYRRNKNTFVITPQGDDIGGDMDDVDIPSERVPEGLKSCEQILKRAKELKKAEPVVSYWCEWRMSGR